MIEPLALRAPPEATAGVTVIESPAGGLRLPLPPAPIIAFVAPAPRGPADLPVAVSSVAEFQRRFGSPAERSRLELVLGQFFDNGGASDGGSAVVVRVPRSRQAAFVRLPGPGGELALRAVHPGPREYLRAAVDYDRIDPDDLWRFNLTVQRVRSPSLPLVEEQEIYPAVSVDPGDPAYVGSALRSSALVRAGGEPPAVRPVATDVLGQGAAGGYVEAATFGDDTMARLARATDYDLIGSPADCTGLHALDLLPRVDAVVLLAPAPDGDLGPVAWLAAERYCRRRQALLLLEAPLAWERGRADDIRTDALPLASANVAICHPRLTAADGGAVCPGVGLLAAWLARDGLRPRPLRSAALPTQALDATSAAQLARRGVNSLVATAGGLALVGGVTLARPGVDRRPWQDLRLRQRALRLTDTLARGTRWALLQPRGPALWSALRAQVSAFLADAEADGWFDSNAAGPAWSVSCDADSHLRGAGAGFIVRFRCGPEFVAFRFVHSLDGCRVSEVVWQPSPLLAN